MRIISGARRGLKLAEIGKGDAGAHLRPTSDRVRESLFNILTGGAYGTPIMGARVLDLFAGTGALGLEALSRGAAHVTFVDDGKVANALIRDNIRAMQAQDTTRLIRRDARELGPCETAPFSLVFLDPPYGKGLGMRALVAAADNDWLTPDALVVCEENAPQTPPAGFARRDSRRYGDTHVTLLQRIAACTP
ncbi:MAG: 16S rRNA (guanine(966)-N(2))-methyltransferase RsmD [Rhodobacter sp.]|jgi:16S rRNA (guanine966-N2)-methyltransferase|nr:16S rRNA (guanine(966)-N(2))-methyltransferase RsmD [Rhodobacter sp.]